MICDEDFKNQRKKVLGYLPQAEIPYNDHLPYSHILDDESDVALRAIKYNLPRAVLLRDLRPGVTYWASQLTRYIRLYGLKFSKGDHVLFVKLLYELLALPDIEGVMIEQLCNLLVKLVKKRHLLTRFDLTLDWKVLRDLQERFCYSKFEPMGLEWIPSTIENKLRGLVRCCRNYFAIEATQDMLEEWRPLICPYDVVMMKAARYFDLFLPTFPYDEAERSKSWLLWKDELLTLWVSCKNGPHWERHFINLFGRLAHNNIGYIDWSSYISPLFVRVLRAFQLPVGKLQPTSALAQQLPFESSTLWMVSMLGSPTSDTVLDNLQQLMTATDSYFHPSNHGRWVLGLINFVQNFLTKFVHRIFRERFKKQRWELIVPPSHQIKDSEIEKIVMIMKPAALLMLYSKTSCMAASRVLQLLAVLKPDLILPSLIDKTFTALDTLTEPHQIRACMTALSSSLHSGIRYFPDCRKHIIPLLFGSLPGLDPNDLPKSVVTFQFISTCMVLIPAVDCSAAVEHHLELSEGDRELCYATAQFEDFILQYLDRCLSLVESLGEEHGSRSHETHSSDAKTQFENISKVLLVTSASVMLQQTTNKIYTLCLRKLFNFATSHLLEGSVAVSTVATLIAACCKINPAQAYELFLPHYCNAILEYCRENPDAKKDDKLDKQFLWDIKILSELTKVGSVHLLKYKENIFEAGLAGLQMDAKDAYGPTSSLLKFTVLSWTTFYCNDRKSVDHSFDQNPASYLGLDDWGVTTTPWKLKMSWHIPCVEELESVFELLDKFLHPVLEKLTMFCNGHIELSKEHLLKYLCIVCQLTSGTSHLVPIDTEDVVTLDTGSEVLFKSWPVRTLEALPGYSSVMDRNNRWGLRVQIFNVVRQTLQKIIKDHGDDVSSICMIVNIYSECALMHEQQKAAFDEHWKVFTSYKGVMRDLLRQNKNRDRFSIIDRVVLQHELRSLALQRSSYTRMNHEIMSDLIQLSVSHYMKVRSNAQAVFFHAMGILPSGVHKWYVPLILQYLSKSDNIPHQELKGVLYLLIGKPKSRNFLGFFHRWHVMVDVWPALIRAPHSEKPSITKLYDKLAVKIQSSFSTIAINTEVSEQCISASLALMSSDSQPSVDSSETLRFMNAGKIFEAERNSANLSDYNLLVNHLLDLYHSNKLSWKLSELVMGMLSLMLRKDIKLPTRLTQLFVEAMIDDSLSIRQLGIACVASIMKKLKRQHTVEMLSLNELGVDNVESFIADQPASAFCAGDRLDNAWIQYDHCKQLDTADIFDCTKFIDKTHFGYYAWPRRMKTYAHHTKQPKLDRTRDELSENEAIVFDHFIDEKFVGKVVEYMSLENVKGKDKFDTKRMDLFRGLFRNFGDSFLPLFKPHIERLVNEKIESHQRCAAEIVAGIVMGAKHWNFEKLNDLWCWLIPLLRVAVSNISSETMKDWDQLFSHIVQNRDPRRIHWVLNFLINEPSKPSSSALIASSKLYVLQGGVHQQEWRVPAILKRVVDTVEPLMGHQYKNVRGRVGSILASVFLFDLRIQGKNQLVDRTPTVENLIKRVVPQLAILLDDDTPPLSGTSSVTMTGSRSDPSAADLTSSVSNEFSLPLAVPPQVHGNAVEMQSLSADVIEMIQSDLKKLPLADSCDMSELKLNVADMLRKVAKSRMRCSEKVEAETAHSSCDNPLATVPDSERSKAIRVFKTVMQWLVSAQRTTLQPFHVSFLQLLPFICKLYPTDHQTGDDELQIGTRLCLSCLAQSIVDDEHVLSVAQAIEQVAASSSWHSRLSVLPYIQVFVFNNLFTVRCSKQCMSILQDIVMMLLEDERYEVSQMACVTLSGLLQCGVFERSMELISRAYTMCGARQKKKRRRDSAGASSSSDVSTVDSADALRQQRELLRRHAGILILSACVLSSPYTVPEWLPQVIMFLAQRLHDAQPIQGTVKRTFSEFRRTHHDNWHEDKRKFTSDELAILTDLLVSPNYYA